MVITLREAVQFICEMKIKVNNHRIHTVKQIKSDSQGIEYETEMPGKIYLTIIFIQCDKLLFTDSRSSTI